MTRLRYVLWLYRQGMLWFQRKAPHREWSTRIYTGLPGSGKTLLMVRDCVQLLRSGVRVYSNLQIVDPLTGLRSEPLGGWLGMLEASVLALEESVAYELRGEIPPGVMFAFDEIHLAADARSWQNTPSWWLGMMAQRRHYGVGLIGTTQDITTVEKRLRLLVGRVVTVRPTALRRFFGRLPLFALQDVDLSLVDVVESDSGIGRWFWSWVGPEAFHGYSTRELMASLDFADLKDDEAKERVRELTERAIALVRPGEFAVFASDGGSV